MEKVRSSGGVATYRSWELISEIKGSGSGDRVQGKCYVRKAQSSLPNKRVNLAGKSAGKQTMTLTADKDLCLVRN